MLEDIVQYLKVLADGDRGLECDGMTRIVTYCLTKNKIQHRVMCGMLALDNRKIASPHYWVELEDGRLIDFRARMWAGDHPYVPHGAFSRMDFPKIGYFGEPIKMSVSAYVFSILSGQKGLPDEFASAKDAAHRPL